MITFKSVFASLQDINRNLSRLSSHSVTIRDKNLVLDLDKIKCLVEKSKKCFRALYDKLSSIRRRSGNGNILNESFYGTINFELYHSKIDNNSNLIREKRKILKLVKEMRRVLIKINTMWKALDIKLQISLTTKYFNCYNLKMEKVDILVRIFNVLIFRQPQYDHSNVPLEVVNPSLSNESTEPSICTSLINLSLSTSENRKSIKDIILPGINSDQKTSDTTSLSSFPSVAKKNLTGKPDRKCYKVESPKPNC